MTDGPAPRVMKKSASLTVIKTENVSTDSASVMKDSMEDSANLEPVRTTAVTKENAIMGSANVTKVS